MNLNVFMNEVHKNAVEHGWWDEERSAGTIRSLIHCELSEAVEEYRSKRPMVWHACPYCSGMCEYQQTQEDALHCEVCEPSSRKPEGIAVELIDAVLRIFDYLGRKEYVFAYDMCTVDGLAAWSLDDFIMDDEDDVLALDVGDFADVLHTEIALSDVMHSETYLVTAAGLMFAWLKNRGVDVEALLNEKHAYNKTRPYKHGGKAI